MGIFGSLVELATDTAKVIVAPVEIAIDVADLTIKPVADLAEQVVEEVKEWKDG